VGRIGSPMIQRLHPNEKLVLMYVTNEFFNGHTSISIRSISDACKIEYANCFKLIKSLEEKAKINIVKIKNKIEVVK